MDKIQKLLSQLSDYGYALQDHADAMVSDLEEAKYEYDRLSSADEFLHPDDRLAPFLAKDFGDGIDSASKYLADAHRGLRDFDKALAKMIEIRGKLAEETGIPMMSHMGTHGFGRESADFVM